MIRYTAGAVLYTWVYDIMSPHPAQNCQPRGGAGGGGGNEGGRKGSNIGLLRPEGIKMEKKYTIEFKKSTNRDEIIFLFRLSSSAHSQAPSPS